MSLACSDRHAFRASWHDYGSAVYFITICAHAKQHLFGNISDNIMYLSEIGNIVHDCIKSLPAHNAMTEIWNYVVMPNHVHMVVSVGARYIAPAQSYGSSINRGCLKPPRHGEECEDYHHNSRLAVIIGTYKAAVTRMARARCIAPLQGIWLCSALRLRRGDGDGESGGGRGQALGASDEAVAFYYGGVTFFACFFA